MDLENSFTVPADIDTAWNTLLDVEAIAPCMPGAKLESVNGDEFTGNVKVKLGPVSMTYGGQAQFLSKDPVAHTAVIKGTGKEARGTGTAQANVTIVLVAESDSVTRVDVATELVITGKAAQFGRGVMQDVAGRLVTQFAQNLEQLIASRVEVVDTENETPRPAPIMAADSINLLETAGAPILKRALPVAIAVALIVGIILLLTARKKKS